MSLLEQTDFDEALKQYYEILRCRQSQIIGIIKETTELVETLNVSADDPGQTKASERKIKLAFSMINALANILDEQMSALDIWERILTAEKPAPQNSGAASQHDFGLPVY